MSFTTEQQRAVDSESGDILVSAGAGSGKTAVLVNRIVRRILEDREPVNVDRLLIVTFTEAAAAEMRSRIYSLLEEKLTKCVDPELCRRIIDQQVRLSGAQISTIHGFCLRVIKENIQESGVDASWSVCDEELKKRLLENAVTETCEKYGENFPERYENLVDAYGQYRSDDGLISAVIDICEFLRSFTDPDKWLREAADAYDAFPDGDFAGSAWGEFLFETARLEVEAYINEFERLKDLCDTCGLVSHGKVADDDLAMMNRLRKVLSDGTPGWERTAREFSAVEFGKLPGKLKRCKKKRAA